jgi:hypothetical protein
MTGLIQAIECEVGSLFARISSNDFSCRRDITGNPVEGEPLASIPREHEKVLRVDAPHRTEGTMVRAAHGYPTNYDANGIIEENRRFFVGVLEVRGRTECMP